MRQNEDSEDLELAKRLLDITKFLEENNEQITDLKKIIDNIEVRFEEDNLALGNWKEELNHKIETLENQNEETSRLSTKIQERISELNKNLENNVSEIKSSQNKLEGEIKEDLSHLETIQEDLKTNFSTEIKESRELILNAFTDEQGKTNSAFDSVNSKISDHIALSQNQFDALKNSMEILGEGLEQLGRLGDNHADSLDEHRDNLSNLKQQFNEIISVIKRDQETHFENFSRIIESYNESIRTELGLTAQSLKESDTKILDEISVNFMPKKVGEKLENMITELTEELKTEAKQSREELVKGLQETVKEYEKIMDEQNIRIKNHQRELERFHDEIQAIIDRKVNEKYEIVYSLLAKVITRSEELSLLIKTAEVHIPKSANTLKNIHPKNETKIDIK
ncbi:MAG: hypothetical protein EAX86_02080 [Candidatus Heimdallarchaeota archaeon]|nr:hypothetical protein [Candidatus Heimdallarchaeota archaeon]